MVKVTYACRLGNQLYQYTAGRLLAQRLGLALQADPIPGFPRTGDAVSGKTIIGPVVSLSGADPIPSWPNVEHLRGKRIDISHGFVNSRYFAGERDLIKGWLSGPPTMRVGEDDVLVNVRLGDFLPGHAQPLGLVLDPSYYTSILDSMKYKTLYLMTDSPGHPYLRHLAKYHPVPIPGYGVEHFFKALAFKRIVMSNSTFCWWFTFLSEAREVYLPVLNGGRCGSWCLHHIPLGIDLRLDLPEVTNVYNVKNWGPSPSPGPTDKEAAEAAAFSKRSKAVFLKHGHKPMPATAERGPLNIAFFTQQLDMRGCGTTLYDYANHNELLLGNKSFIVINGCWPRERSPARPRFEQRFGNVFEARGVEDMEHLVRKLDIDLWYEQCALGDGEPIPRDCKVAVHTIFKSFAPHGDVYAYVSNWLRDVSVPENLWPKYGFVPHMVDQPGVSGDLRDELHIPRDARVFGYHGGPDSFDIQFVRETVEKALEADASLYFVFLSVAPWISHPRVIFLPSTLDMQRKFQFINTCDACLYARSFGETFGLSLAEFSVMNKPILAYRHPPADGACHLRSLTKAFFYEDAAQLLDMLLHLRFDKSADWNSYGDSLTPAKVMEQFDRVFIKGVSPQADAPTAAQDHGTEIEVLPNCNIAVIRGDNGIGSWVHHTGRLDYDRVFLDFVSKYIKEGCAVLDIGACVGVHTFEYLKHASAVVCFEPNPTAFACLEHNCPKAVRHMVALGDKFCQRYWTRIFPNVGASYLADEASPGCLIVPVRPLDSFDLPEKIGYIKIDAEGEEVAILRGGKNTILKHMPAICMEVNHPALARTRTSAEELFSLLSDYGYGPPTKVPGTDHGFQYDAVVMPRGQE